MCCAHATVPVFGRQRQGQRDHSAGESFGAKCEQRGGSEGLADPRDSGQRLGAMAQRAAGELQEMVRVFAT